MFVNDQVVKDEDRRALDFFETIIIGIPTRSRKGFSQVVEQLRHGDEHRLFCTTVPLALLAQVGNGSRQMRFTRAVVSEQYQPTYWIFRETARRIYCAIQPLSLRLGPI